jgi:hypothetical protein
MISNRTESFRFLIRKSPECSGIDENLILSIIEQESGGIYRRTRFEAGSVQLKYLFHARDYASVLGITEQTEAVAQCHSYGLMQMMGYVARETGFDGYFSELSESPDLQLKYAGKKLKLLFHRYSDEMDVISAWNLGSAIRTTGGLYLNEKAYVDPVADHLRDLRALK